MTKIAKEDIEAIECRFAVYLPPPKHILKSEKDPDDYHMVKELVHLKNGEKVKRLRFIKNFKRPFYITKKHIRTQHTQKREKELLDNLDRWECKQYQLEIEVGKKLGIKGNPRTAMHSPYLYGTDITSTAYIKGMYRRKYPDARSFYDVAVFDTETDMTDDTIIIASLTFKKQCITVVREDWIQGISMPERDIRATLHRYLGEHIEKRQINWEIVIAKDEMDLVQTIFNRAHLWSPDFIAVWNLEFDLKKILECCKRFNVDPTTLFNDPSVPKGYETLKIRWPNPQEVTNKGVVKNLASHEKWHFVNSACGFQFIDAMTAYYLLRISEQNEPSYALEYIANKEINSGKMKFEEANHLAGNGSLWHAFMQRNYKLEYVAYNAWDCLIMEILDEETLDLCLSVPNAAKFSDFTKFDSQPLRIMPKIYWYLLDKGMVFANAGGIRIELDDYLPELSGWIVTMPAHLLSVKGLRCVK